MSMDKQGRRGALRACLMCVEKELGRDAANRVRQFLLPLASGVQTAPGRGGSYDWGKVAIAVRLPEGSVRRIREPLKRALKALEAQSTENPPQPASAISAVARRPGRPPNAIVEFPQAVAGEWKEPVDFRTALDLHMRRHGDSSYGLAAALREVGGQIFASTIAVWRRGSKVPQSADSLRLLALIERRYRLPIGYFRTKCERAPRAIRREALPGVTPAEMRRLAWHLPDDIAERPLAECEEILAWVRKVILSGATEYRLFQAAAIKHRYALQFRIAGSRIKSRGGADGDNSEEPLVVTGREAPRALNAEMAALVAFKTATLTPAGQQRTGVWGLETADQRIEHLGLLLGAMAASPSGTVNGLGVPVSHLTLGLLAFPSVWDWYVQWRERRRGFYTRWEVDLLSMGVAFTRAETGWVRQTPSLAQRLKPIPGLLSAAEVSEAQQDWAAACERAHRHGLARTKEIERVARIHRDPFEPILPVLEAENPLAEYRKITDEIARRIPDARQYPKAAAEAVRAFLMIRIGLHTGLRQRNLRELMICSRGAVPRTDRWLSEHRRGEMRWSEREGGWEIYIPSVAFKNATSSFFGSRPFRLLLPDLSDLYLHLDAYVAVHRQILLAGFSDPGTLFVKSIKAKSLSAAYEATTFYETWRFAIQRYGIYNPYTRRGAIEGLLPHGPHNVRDVLATHILKQTGSYEQASYAIQDTPEMVANHYGRFLPQDKASLAAQVLNKVWV